MVIKNEKLEEPMSQFMILTVHSHDTRKKSYFCIIGCRTVIREHSINILYGPKFWDTLPVAIQDAVCLGSLKRSLLDLPL